MPRNIGSDAPRSAPDRAARQLGAAPADIRSCGRLYCDVSGGRGGSNDELAAADCRQTQHSTPRSGLADTAKNAAVLADDPAEPLKNSVGADDPITTVVWMV